MTEKTPSKALPTTEGKQNTKKAYIIKYHANNPEAPASEIAEKIKTTPSYVWKTLSEARKHSKDIRGRSGRIFAHGKVYYECWATPDLVSSLNASVVNPRTGMKQIGCVKWRDPCCCQIHSNGHLIIWARSIGWQEWLVEEMLAYGWSKDIARLIVDNARLTVSIAEGGIKPGDPSFLPKDFYLETEWGVIVARDNTPEKGVLELKISIPDMQRYLGLPEIKKRLGVIEQGSMTQLQSQKTIEAILISLYRWLQAQSQAAKSGDKETFC
jgi:hypothetical protein